MAVFATRALPSDAVLLHNAPGQPSQPACSNHTVLSKRALEVLLRQHIAEIFNVSSSTPIDHVSALAQRESAGHTGHSFLLRRIRRAVGGAHFDSPEGDFIIYRLFVTQPWPGRLADPGMRTNRLLGRVFDLPGMYHRFERPIADAWCRWSFIGCGVSRASGAKPTQLMMPCRLDTFLPSTAVVALFRLTPVTSQGLLPPPDVVRR
jgi:hypothetical protein